MKSWSEERLVGKLRALSPEQRAEVEDFVDLLVTKVKRGEAFDRLLAIAPALEAAGVTPATEEEINDLVKVVRRGRHRR